MKTKEELNTLKAEVEAMNKKLADLTDEELAKVASGAGSEGLSDRIIRRPVPIVDPGPNARGPEVIP